MAKIISIANQKGGVGKTTTTFNMGVGLAKQGKKVLLLDFDPQGNLSSYVGYQADEKPTISDLINYVLNTGAPSWPPRENHPAAVQEMEVVRDYLISSIRTNLREDVDYIPSTIILSGAEQALMNAMCREQVLKTILSYLTEFYEYILIDCPPSLGVLSINALTASTEILVPVQAQNFALDGLIQLMDTYKRVRAASNPDLCVNGFLVTMVNHTIMSRSVIETLEANFGELVYATKISASTDAPTSTVDQRSLKGRLGEQYSDAAHEFINREV